MTIDVLCPSCGSESFDESIDVADGFCENCGAVIPDANNVDELSFPELDSTNDGDNVSSIPDSWSEWYSVTNSTEQRVATAFEYLEKVSDSVGLSEETRIRAAKLYCDASLDLVTDGRPSDATVSALLYLASRDTHETRPVSVFSRAIERDDAKINSLARSFQRELELELPIPEPEDYISHLVTELDFEDETVEGAYEVLDTVTSNGIMTGKNPVSIAGAVLYRQGDQHSQREIAQAAGVTKETIRKRLNEVEDRLDDSEPVGVRRNVDG